ncbi:hypothetical protein NLX71_11945 [Paenibacillus sp. MZ04-78.2]|uniref:hypothetical protein n=1 Tax=Paenibacillus sp. MZ04-78.2 TaxID=2962034 RepID=UPI0020B8E2C2|nr:hypothetical protein [Paenibacillus sp. MZ04-78.2]MCP3774014.1 hypothetical protein [Paenibacillus sp. MZ04-78.2]
MGNKILRLLEQRYTDGFYSDYDIWYDPMHPEVGRANDYPKIPVKSPIPELMLKSVGTKVIDLYPEGYDEGIPFEVYDKISALYD